MRTAFVNNSGSSSHSDMNSFSHRTSDRGTAACEQIGLPIKINK